MLQGGEDRVVPREQADRMVEALVENDTPYAYVEFPEERHGFRDAAAFGFDPAGDLPPLELDRGTFRKRTVDGDDEE